MACDDHADHADSCGAGTRTRCKHKCYKCSKRDKYCRYKLCALQGMLSARHPQILAKALMPSRHR